MSSAGLLEQLREPAPVDRPAPVPTERRCPGGLRAILRDRGPPFAWSPLDRRFWQYALWGLRLSRGGGRLALHKRHVHLGEVADTPDQRLVRPLSIEPGDERRPAPIRDRWVTIPNPVAGGPGVDTVDGIPGPRPPGVGGHEPGGPG